jgi:hypothetical protein
MRTILLVILILLLLGALPLWPYSAGWGYYPGGGLGLILIRQYQGLWCTISASSLIEAGRCLCQAMRKSPSVPGVYDR